MESNVAYAEADNQNGLLEEFEEPPRHRPKVTATTGVTFGVAFVAFVMAAVALSRSDTSAPSHTAGSSAQAIVPETVHREIARDYKSATASLVGSHPFCHASTTHFRACADLIDTADDLVNFVAKKQSSLKDLETAVKEDIVGSKTVTAFTALEGKFTSITKGIVAKAGQTHDVATKKFCSYISKNRVCVALLADKAAHDHMTNASATGSRGRARLAVVIDPQPSAHVTRRNWFSHAESSLSSNWHGSWHGAENAAISGAESGAISGAEHGAWKGAVAGAIGGLAGGPAGVIGGAVGGAIEGGIDGGIHGAMDGALGGEKSYLEDQGMDDLEDSL